MCVCVCVSLSLSLCNWETKYTHCILCIPSSSAPFPKLCLSVCATGKRSLLLHLMHRIILSTNSKALSVCLCDWETKYSLHLMHPIILNTIPEALSSSVSATGKRILTGFCCTPPSLVFVQVLALRL